jgi:hypothetical protein
MRYAISNVKNVLIPGEANTTASIYPVLKYKAFKLFPQRAKAREYKRTRRYSQQYVIVDTQRKMVVR